MSRAGRAESGSWCWQGLHFLRWSTTPCSGLLLGLSRGGYSPHLLPFSLHDILKTNVPFGYPGIGCANLSVLPTLTPSGWLPRGNDSETSGKFSCSWFWLYYKGYHSGTAQWKRSREQVPGRGGVKVARPSMLSPSPPLAQHIDLLTNPEIPKPH